MAQQEKRISDLAEGNYERDKNEAYFPASIGAKRTLRYSVASAEQAANKYTDEKIADLASTGGNGNSIVPVTVVVGVNSPRADISIPADTQDCIEYLERATNMLPTGGGKIVLLQGRYHISESLEIKKDNVILEGQGNATKIILTREDDLDSGIGFMRSGIISITGNKCKVRDLNLSTSSTRIGTSVGIILVGNGNTVTGNTISNGGNTFSVGIYFVGNGNNATGNAVSNSGTSNGFCYGIASDGNGNTVTGNAVSNSHFGTLDIASVFNCVGIILSGNDNNATSNMVSNSSSDNSICYGIAAIGKNNAVTGNMVSNIKTNDGKNDCYGIYLGGGGNAIVGNMVSNSHNGSSTGNCVGITLLGNSNTAAGNTVSNSSTNIGYCYGIQTSGSSGNAITGNAFAGKVGSVSSTWAFYVASSSTYNLFTNNNCRNWTSNGAALLTTTGNTNATAVGTSTAVSAINNGAMGFNVV